MSVPYMLRPMFKFLLICCLHLLCITMLSATEGGKSASMLSIEKKINDDCAAYINQLKSRQQEVLEKLGNYKTILQNVNSGKWTLDERNMGCSIIDAKIESIKNGMNALIASQAVENIPNPNDNTSVENYEKGNAPIKATKSNTIPNGKYIVKVCAHGGADIYINEEHFSAGEMPTSFEYEVSGPIQIKVKGFALYGRGRHGFGFIMQNANGKEVITTKSGWKSYRPNSLTEWYLDKEVLQLGKVYETLMPSPLSKTALIWDEREDGAAQCYLVWGL